MSQMDKAGLEALQAATIKHAAQHGIKQSSMADYQQIDKATADAIMGTQRGYNNYVFSLPMKERTFTPLARFSGDTAKTMRQSMAALINSPLWSNNKG